MRGLLALCEGLTVLLIILAWWAACLGSGLVLVALAGACAVAAVVLRWRLRARCWLDQLELGILLVLAVPGCAAFYVCVFLLVALGRWAWVPWDK